MKKAIPITLILLALSVYVYFARIRPAREVDPTVRGSGSIEVTEVVIAAKVPARILGIEVEEGDQVERGQVLATLDCSDLEVRKTQAEAQVAQARAAKAQAEAGERQARSSLSPLKVKLAFARKERDRAQSLFASSVASQRQVDKAQNMVDGLEEQMRTATLGVAVARSAIAVGDASVNLAEKTVDLARTSLEECTLIAPSPGVVMTRTREVGELILPGSTLLKLGKLDEVFTWIYVPNEEIGKVRLGQEVELKADTYPDRTFVGTITRVNESAEFTPKSIQTKEDRTRLVFGVKVSIDNADRALMPGMPVEAALRDSAGSAPTQAPPTSPAG